MEDEWLNEDLSKNVVMRTGEMEWTESPMSGVKRKRVFRKGGVECGRVSSLVSFAPGSSFNNHPHPQGEEIFVLTGVFSDWRGDHGPGTYLLNPEGFEHAPSSDEGCTIFVRLRQYPGEDRPQIALDTNKLEWEDTEAPGIHRKILFLEENFDDSAELQKWDEGATFCEIVKGGLEIFVLHGELIASLDENKGNEHEETCDSGTWIRMANGASFRARSEGGCELYVKRNHFGCIAPEP
eukprot:CAMPEP_0174254144 /NCGR_PEP_ID=MMETSP0439-20130205/3499_1 /TAXON_ID=0 /ORGANISM="Stereomyxa ramosa, Strain Chinc5" /LENGTH=237 /DNA_ID=CAMNT_0015335583 /DNA_START=58 /DNA_END=771 /DNA_ORIENTATION=-